MVLENKVNIKPINYAKLNRLSEDFGSSGLPKSIDQGPFELGTTRDTLGTTPKGGVLLGLEIPRTYEGSLGETEKKMYDAELSVLKLHKRMTRRIQLYDEFERFKMLPDVDDERLLRSIFMAILSSAEDDMRFHNDSTTVFGIDSTSAYRGNSNVIPYEQYLSVNNISIVPSCASSTLNNVCVSSHNDVFVPHDPIANELKIYKEQVAIYKQRAKFELTEHEQRMDEMRTVTTLKQELKQKESKFLTDFSNLKHLNDKLENKLHSQDQSIQIVYMMLNPTQVYDQKTKTALGVQNPCYLRQAKKAQPTLYDGDELLKPHHVPVIVPSSEEELELAEL
ncbi:hypothetical protein Tco_1173398 [Tanacetum coccineum]